MSDTPAIPTTPRPYGVPETIAHWRRQAELCDSDMESATFLHCADEIEEVLALVPARSTPAEALPPEALEWARQLVEQGYRDEHIVTFTEDGYGLEHPIACRPNLIGCILNEWLATQMAPDRDPGRYVMEWAEDGPKYMEVGA